MGVGCAYLRLRQRGQQWRVVDRLREWVAVSKEGIALCRHNRGAKCPHGVLQLLTTPALPEQGCQGLHDAYSQSLASAGQKKDGTR